MEDDSEVEISKQNIFLFQGEGELLRSMTMEGKGEGLAEGEGELECRPSGGVQGTGDQGRPFRGISSWGKESDLVS